jgi:tetratricopeptide (TPR) repeat protein
MPTAPHNRPARRLLILGWDAADWRIIDPLLAAGRMPNLAALLARGVRGDLRSLEPMLSPLLWTSIATGKYPDAHGILNFVEPAPDASSLRPATSTSRKTKALWNIAHQAGLTSHTVAWYATHPAEPVRGSIVTNLFHEGSDAPARSATIPDASVHPPGDAAHIASRRARPGDLEFALVSPLVPKTPRAELLPSPTDARRDASRVRLLRRIIAQGLSVQRLALDRLATPGRAWDVGLVLFETVDVAGHHFMPFLAPKMDSVDDADFARYQRVVPGVYELQDRWLGELLKAIADPEHTAVIILSDHGFHSDHLRPSPSGALADDEHAAMDATWHRPLGMLAMAGPGIARSKTVHGATLLDILPTALALLGLPAGKDMPGRVLAEVLESPPGGPLPVPDRIDSWDALEGDAGLHPPDARQNAFDAAEAMKQLVELGYMPAPTGTIADQLAKAERETKYNLAAVYLSSARTADAVAPLEQIAREDPGEARYASSLAQALYELGRFDNAKAAIDTLLKVRPGDVQARLFLVGIAEAQGRSDEAIAMLEAMLPDVEGRSRVDVLCVLGDVLLRRSQHADAERRFAQAAGLDRHSARAHTGLSASKLAQRAFELAAESALDAAELLAPGPDRARAHELLGAALAWMGDTANARRALETARAECPGAGEVDRWLEVLTKHAARGSPTIKPLSAGVGPDDWARAADLD